MLSNDWVVSVSISLSLCLSPILWIMMTKLQHTKYHLTQLHVHSSVVLYKVKWYNWCPEHLPLARLKLCPQKLRTSSWSLGPINRTCLILWVLLLAMPGIIFPNNTSLNACISPVQNQGKTQSWTQISHIVADGTASHCWSSNVPSFQMHTASCN